ncbi:hypothetical protein ACJX0J_027405, partial [Zea mays]
SELLFVEVLFDIISAGVILQDARHNMRGNKFNLIINLNVSIQKAKALLNHDLQTD